MDVALWWMHDVYHSVDARKTVRARWVTMATIIKSISGHDLACMA